MNPLSLFNKPAAAKNINLLPEEEVAALFVKRDLFLALSIPAASLILLAAAFVGLFILETRQKVKHNDLTRKITQTKSDRQKYADTASTLVQINTDVGIYQTATDKNEGLHDSLVAISSLVPASVVLNRLDLTAAGETGLDGSAPDPKDIYQFIDTLKKKSGTYTAITLKNVSYSSADGTYKFSVSFVVGGK
ncbi:MAG: hypothetical protein A2Z24_02910 [Candidatus Woykebacteria bacterium RBG_16_44_10]|uniref:Fimbrial assembly protein n=1 Tax=Candidatus Woykebacteria bacterium RBG_16_44_10 TaxID=1802597 RepID=A0A1G1WDQ3_9BACT|nr:MAG: hypothetical protein A2Z24_02910 [Candidatus Woykebacteria bacterium RBG_16_44_10]